MVKKQTVFALGEVKEAEKEIFIENYINEFYLYDAISYTIFYKSIWPETKTGSEKIDDYNLYLDSNINRIDIEIGNIKKL